MSGAQEYWIVACGCSKMQSGQSEKDIILADLKAHPAVNPRARGGGRAAAPAPAGGEDCGPWKFDVPDGERSLMFGSFDNLIRLTDDLHKHDVAIETIVHRLERQYIELDPNAYFKVKSQRQEKPFLDYLKAWHWDEAKYPRTRSISDNMTLLMQTVSKLDEETRNKTMQYNDLKTQKGNIAKKDAQTIVGRELVDVLTPDVVVAGARPSAEDDFVYSDYVTTVVVILPRGADDEFLKCYEFMTENVVPTSAKHFKNLDDKEGNMVWRVVMFRSAVDPFKRACRDRRYHVRDFEYSEEAYKKLKVQRDQIDDQVKRQHDMVRGLYQAAWSDTMVAWMHVKATRVFVESVLRFGMPPRFASFVIAPRNDSSQAALARKALTEILGARGGGNQQGDMSVEHEHEDGEEYFPYVSFSLTPFVVQR